MFITYWTIDVSPTVPYEITSVRLSITKFSQD